MSNTKFQEINDETIKELVDSFYIKILADDLLGAIFKRHIGEKLDDWGEHLATMYRFWSSVMNGTGRYKGSPHMVHGRIAHEVAPEMFQRWLTLWFQTSVDLFEPNLARKFQKKAEMIAKSLHYTMCDTQMPEEIIPQFAV